MPRPKQPRLAAAVPTLEAASEALGTPPEGASVHLDRDYDSIIKSAEADIVIIDEGTNPDGVRNSGAFPLFGWPTIIGTRDQVRAHIQGLVDAGINYVIVYIPRIAYDREPLHRFAEEILPEFV